MAHGCWWRLITLPALVLLLGARPAWAGDTLRAVFTATNITVTYGDLHVWGPPCLSW